MEAPGAGEGDDICLELLSRARGGVCRRRARNVSAKGESGCEGEGRFWEVSERSCAQRLGLRRLSVRFGVVVFGSEREQNLHHRKRTQPYLRQRLGGDAPGGRVLSCL